MKVVTYRKTSRAEKRNDFFRRKQRDAVLSLFNMTVLCNTELGVDSSVALARFVSHEGLNEGNYLLFFVMLSTNNPYVIDALIDRREPALLFAPIKPNWFLVKESFKILARFRHDEMYEKLLLALLGIIQNVYKTSKSGYKLYPLRISDVYNLGKFLNKDKGQGFGLNCLLLDILDDIYQVGIVRDSAEAKDVALKANRIRMSFFDDRIRMADTIPNVLLVGDTETGRAIRPKFMQLDAPT